MNHTPVPVLPLLWRHLGAFVTAAALTAPGAAHAAPPIPTSGQFVAAEAREAARKRDRPRLAAMREAAQATGHPLLPWVEYWDLGSRLTEAKAEEVDAFFERWRGSYLEDRLRNDWLLELGRRRDWAAISREYPRFRMNDDREVTCWWLLTEHLRGRDVREAARQAWFAQREADEGCTMLATALVDRRILGADDVWRKARLSIEAQRPALARTAVGLLGNVPARELSEALNQPARYLRGAERRPNRARQELRLLAILRVAANDADAAAGLLETRSSGLTREQSAWAWAYAGRRAAFRMSADAASHFRRAWARVPRNDVDAPGWSDDTLAWAARAALRATPGRDGWVLLTQAIAAMPPAMQADPTWVYWKARAQIATADRSSATSGESSIEQARLALQSIASPLHFYGQLALEDLGQAPALASVPPPNTPVEREAARAHPGLARAMVLASSGLRDEARREWNFSLRGMDDRQLLAAARWACEEADWQLCINTSDRTRESIDLATRFPMPFQSEILEAAAAQSLDPAFVFGLIRQETRFMAQLRSHAGASGLMQLMPATARWVARKTGAELRPQQPEQLFEPELNLKLGTAYLRMVLDDLSGSLPLAAAAYNAGPGRPRRWREGPTLEPAAWAEAVPFDETRDYIKKVLANSVVYALLMRSPDAALKPRLGPRIGPREGGPPVNTELP
ncbi:MAG: lytic transglycosylase domain-containing protein [Burkholderiaceae bacterium]|nr:lytic transglycosylase domain-containing protein [Aquabacterium sp.]NUP84665.1 lytic transglycosylase domain-containing protein [Burkholderiaceae bacterium]